MLKGLTPVAALATALALLAAGIVASAYYERSYENQKARDIAVQARILAQGVTAALSFNDRRTAEEYVKALEANPDIQAVAIYDDSSTPFATFVRPGAEPPPAMPARQPPSISKGHVTIVLPIEESRTDIGTVFVRASLEPYQQRFARYSAFALLIVMASLVVAVLGVAQARLRQVNDQLEVRARDLEKAYADLQAATEERQRAEEALRQAQKMETIGQLTGGVAHDFNNLLTIVLGNLERLVRRIDQREDPATMRRAAESAIAGAQRAASLTRSLLAFSRRQPLSPKPVDMNRLVSNMAELLRRTLGESVTIQSVVSGGLWLTEVDPNQLENAILNLAVNARDAMPNGGRLTIETANAYLDARYVASEPEVRPGQYVVLSVTDTGIGMAKEVADKVFEPFFTTKDVGKGTGLGLSQVYGFVKQSGGHVRIYSEPGQGTSVKIYLPRLVGKAADAEPIDLDQSDPVQGNANGGTVLVVEDEAGVREHSVETLREAGYRVLAAENGEAALRVIDGEPSLDLLFTDVGLPGGMTGRQLADEARRRRPGLKVLFTTGYARNAIVHDGRLDAGVELITKPFPSTDLIRTVRRLTDTAYAQAGGERLRHGAGPADNRGPASMPELGRNG
jgi:signal transduction histidine kinase